MPSQPDLFSLDDLNTAIAELVGKLNARPFKKLDGCRRSAFETLDRPVLRPLPATRWELARWAKAKVNIDYHVEYDRRLYSVPHALVGGRVELRATNATVEIFHPARRVASHARMWGPRGSASTVPEHRPRSHRSTAHGHHRESSGGLRRSSLRRRPWSNRFSSAGREPESAYRSCMALIRSAKPYGRARFDAACRRALAIGAPNRKSVLAILSCGLDATALDTADPQLSLGVAHENVRGVAYYDRKETESS